ncbi:MAG: SwmB domain-containing protein, partial [Synechocystis sp.]
YDVTALEDSSNNAIADFSQISVTNDSSQTYVTAYNPNSGNANNYTTTNQTSLIGNLEADFAQDSPPALALVTNSSTTEGQVLAVWSKEVQPIAAIAGFVNSNQIYLNFVQALNTSSVPSNSQFSLTVNGIASTITVTNVSIESNGYVLLNLSGTVQTTDIVSLTYTPTAINQATSNLYLTDALGAKLWVPDFSLDLSNTTGQNISAAPNLLGGSAVILNGNENLITLIFNQTLNDKNTPNTSQFSVVSNGVALTASNVVVSGNTVTF